MNAYITDFSQCMQECVCVHDVGVGDDISGSLEELCRVF